MSHPDRIDFIKINGKVVINKLERREGRDFPTSHDVVPDFDLDAALAWCTANGYAVRKWAGGARAWKGGKPWVIRTASQIMRMRERNSCKVNLDFAFDG